MSGDISLDEACIEDNPLIWKCSFKKEAVYYVKRTISPRKLVFDRLQNSVIDLTNMPFNRSIKYLKSPFNYLSPCDHVENSIKIITIEEEGDGEIKEIVCVSIHFLVRINLDSG